MNLAQRKRIEEMLIAAMTSGLKHKGPDYKLPESLAIEYGRICYNLAINDILAMLKLANLGDVGVQASEIVSDFYLTQKVTL
jgi:hypothetical protein